MGQHGIMLTLFHHPPSLGLGLAEPIHGLQSPWSWPKIPPKLHIIIDHLDEYFSDTNLSLVKTSDQLIENMHQYVHKVMSRSMYTVKDPLNPQHGKLLFKAVKHINSMNICINKTCI